MRLKGVSANGHLLRCLAHNSNCDVCYTSRRSEGTARLESDHLTTLPSITANGHLLCCLAHNSNCDVCYTSRRSEGTARLESDHLTTLPSITANGHLLRCLAHNSNGHLLCCLAHNSNGHHDELEVFPCVGFVLGFLEKGKGGVRGHQLQLAKRHPFSAGKNRKGFFL